MKQRGSRSVLHIDSNHEMSAMTDVFSRMMGETFEVLDMCLDECVWGTVFVWCVKVRCRVCESTLSCVCVSVRK